MAPTVSWKVLLMYLDILAKTTLAMSVEVKLRTSHDGTRTQGRGYASLRRERIQPHDSVIDHENCDDLWKNFEWEGMATCSAPLLDDTVLPFNLWNVLRSGRNVQCYAHL